MKPLTPYQELKSLLARLETTSVAGYHRTRYETQLKEAIAAFDSYGFMIYILTTPEYQQLIGKAKKMVGQESKKLLL